MKVVAHFLARQFFIPYRTPKKTAPLIFAISSAIENSLQGKAACTISIANPYNDAMSIDKMTDFVSVVFNLKTLSKTIVVIP